MDNKKKHTIEEAIDLEFGGTVKRALMAIICVVRNGPVATEKLIQSNQEEVEKGIRIKNKNIEKLNRKSERRKAD